MPWLEIVILLVILLVCGILLVIVNGTEPGMRAQHDWRDDVPGYKKPPKVRNLKK